MADRVQGLRTKSGGLAMFATIRLASSRVSKFAAVRRPGLVLKIDICEGLAL